MRKGISNKVVKKVLVTMLTATLICSSGYSIYAASVREAWNNAASSTATGTTLSDGSVVYSNVYADSAAWESWKTEWNTIRTNYEQVALTPGTDATNINFGWYSHTVETPAVRITDSQGNSTGVTFYGTQNTNAMSVTEGAVTASLYSNKVTMTGIKEATTYYYQYFFNGQWSSTYKYQSRSTNEFSFLYVGDPQIGASVGQTATETNTFANPTEYYARNDAYNWKQTIASVVKNNTNLSFILSAGDQINQTTVDTATKNLEQQVEYAGFLNPSELRSLPIATAIGNHDSLSANYKNHFNNPNSYTAETGASVAGNDYFFSYGDALFVTINTNNYNCDSHKTLINEAIATYPNVKWKVLMFHQDIYGSGLDHSDSDGMVLRTQLTPIIDSAGFDVVLQGHDHTYSRTYPISSAGTGFQTFTNTSDVAFKTVNASCYNIMTNIQADNKVIDPKGTVYFEASSSTGSKFYQLISTKQDYIAVRTQSWRPTYSVISIDEVSLNVKTYDAATNLELVADGGSETAFSIIKSVDKTNLSGKLSEATAILTDTSAYTSDSVVALKAVMQAAQLIFDNPESTSVDVASAYSSVADAVNALKKIEAAVLPTLYSSSVMDTTPQTGDSMLQLYACLILAAVSGATLIVMFLYGRKKNDSI